MALLDLSDEVLVHICLFLSGIDKIAFSRTCTRIHRILNEKKLIRKINFSNAYQLTAVSLKEFFRPKLRYENVISLDLSSCYWLPASDMYSCLIKMKNLTHLNVIDTSLSRRHIFALLTELKVTHLSCSCYLPENTKITIPHLQYLRMENLTWMLKELWRTIHFFPNLQELWIAFTGLHGKNLSGDPLPLADDGFRLPHLHTLAVRLDVNVPYYWVDDTEVPQRYGLARLLMRACADNSDWRVYWLDTSERILADSPIKSSSQMTALMPPYEVDENHGPFNLGKISFLGCRDKMRFEQDLEGIDNVKLTHLVLPSCISDVTYIPHTLVHLSITGCWVWCQLKVLSSLENLRILTIPFCLFLNPGNNAEFVFPTPGPSQQRMSRISTDPWPHGRLAMFVKMSPNLEHLQIVGCVRNGMHSKPKGSMHDECAGLAHICNWTNLRSLTLNKLSVRISPYLVKIAIACPKMEAVNFVHVQGYHGPATYIPHLKEALKHWRNLKRLS